ncbi:MAG: protein translocase subunit SecF [Rhodospirillaceae bacterium]|nr:protein translocase subunit SecF [Rhodospirillaceae bacterium]MCA8932121.1 protein translocase subunit SecF [Rhodospirillaceae bacterium]
MRPLRLVPTNTRIPFLRYRRFAFALSSALVVLSVVFLILRGLNFGIDFAGGILIEIQTNEPADIAELRGTLGGLQLGEVSLQEFGGPNDVLIRVQRQEGDEEAQAAAISTVQSALGDQVAEYRRVEFVGPTVGAELIEAGIIAVVLAQLAILAYIWLRFEWQYGVCAIIALVHDVASTIGLFALIQHEFNLTTVAALLTIAGYSINDTVVVFDRVRENLRRYKKAQMTEVLDRSLNETLSRTTMTSFTTLLALLALYVFGGAVIRDFAFALIWGIGVGTYSSIFVAVPLLLTVKLRSRSAAKVEASQAKP